MSKNDLQNTLNLARVNAQNTIHFLLDALEDIDTANGSLFLALHLREDIAEHLRHATAARDGIRESIDRLE